NERLFGIEVERDLLTVDGVQKSPLEVYVKVKPAAGTHFAEESLEEWIERESLWHGRAERTRRKR
ncbi:MAG: hypothetical protein C4576_01600, partial [Desulfobacteraceae bacterium]